MWNQLLIAFKRLTTWFGYYNTNWSYNSSAGCTPIIKTLWFQKILKHKYTYQRKVSDEFPKWNNNKIGLYGILILCQAVSVCKS